jgi:hypothetical protein
MQPMAGRSCLAAATVAFSLLAPAQKAMTRPVRLPPAAPVVLKALKFLRCNSAAQASTSATAHQPLAVPTQSSQLLDLVLRGGARLTEVAQLAWAMVCAAHCQGSSIAGHAAAHTLAGPALCLRARHRPCPPPGYGVCA